MKGRPRREKRVLIMGAGGRDFHNFLAFYRDKRGCRVVAFTAAQIPFISRRHFPAALAGKRYPKGIPIFDESRLESLIRRFGVDEVVFSYSDVSAEHVAETASRAMAAGASFKLLGPHQTQLKSKKPVIAVCAVRTGCGKSQTTRKLARLLKEKGYDVGVIRHPMPYGKLEKQVVEKFASWHDLAKYKCTIEEREEYEPYLEEGLTIYAGVDFERILRAAEKESDVILWDGGNNDFPFYKPDYLVTVVDPHRAGHSRTHFPGMVNVLLADTVVVNKEDSSTKKEIAAVVAEVKALNPRAKIVHADSRITVDAPEKIRGKKVIVVEDGPTTTHGGMNYGAGYLAAKKFGAKIVDPRKHAAGSLKALFRRYPAVKAVLPAMGYAPKQRAELRQTIEKSGAVVAVVGTPIDLQRVLSLKKECVRVHYELAEKGKPDLSSLVKGFEKRFLKRGKG